MLPRYAEAAGGISMSGYWRLSAALAGDLAKKSRKICPS